MYTTASAVFTKVNATYSQTGTPAGTTSDIFADGTSATARSFVDGEIWFDFDDATSTIAIKRYDSIGSDWDNIATDATVATGGYVMNALATQPVGSPVNGALWHNTTVNDLALFEVV